MRLEDFLAQYLPETHGDGGWDLFRAALLRTSVTMRKLSTTDTSIIKQAEPELVQYLELEETGDLTVQWWFGTQVANIQLGLWRYISPNGNCACAGIVELQSAGVSKLSLIELGSGLTEAQSRVWAIARFFASENSSIVSEGSAWTIQTEMDRRLRSCSNETGRWDAIPEQGLPELAFDPRFSNQRHRASRSDLVEYPVQLAADLTAFGSLQQSVPRLNPDDSNSCPFPLRDLELSVREQNTFTLPEGVDGRVDQAPGRRLAGIPLSTQLAFLRTGHIGPSRFWLYGFTDKVGNDIYLTAQRTPIEIDNLNAVRCWPGYAKLTPDQLLLFAFAHSLFRSGLRVAQRGSGWAIADRLH